MPSQPDPIGGFTGQFNLVSQRYRIVKTESVGGKTGITAEHQDAFIFGDTQRPKKAYYVEGNHRQMGYLLGKMAEEDISLMTNGFVNNML